MRPELLPAANTSNKNHYYLSIGGCCESENSFRKRTGPSERSPSSVSMQEHECRRVGDLGRSGTLGRDRESVRSSPYPWFSTILPPKTSNMLMAFSSTCLPMGASPLQLSRVDAQTAPWCRAHADHPRHTETTGYESDGRSDRREALRRTRGCIHR
jgi:hypothetical protein